MPRDIAADIEDFLPSQEIRLTPFQPLDDFLLKATWNVPDFSNLPKLNNRIVSNLLFYQTNYFVFGIVLFLLIGINYPVDFLFGLVVVAAVLMGFVYVSSTAQSTNNILATAKQILISAKEDRPILIFIGLLGVSYLVLSFLGKLFIFIFGIVLPVQAILLHATLHKRSWSNKLSNKFDKAGLQSSPMSVFLRALGLRKAALFQDE